MQIILPATVRLALHTGDRRRIRSGGKAAATRLKCPVKPHSKRGKFLKWFLEEPSGRTVGACRANFQMTRANVFTYWTTIQREHGIGYELSNNTISVILPDFCDPQEIFGVAHGA